MSVLGVRWSWILALGWLAVTVVGLFVPLMDNDSAHHANIVSDRGLCESGRL
jgi:hypothetical protein